MRILGIDPGERRIGLAISDPLGITAQGLDTFDVHSATDFLTHVGDVLARYGVDEIVVGHPIHLSGEPGESAAKARDLAEKLQERFEIDVKLWDERLSSVEAKRVLKGTGAEKGAVDKLAAVIILQSYLDYRRNRA